MSSGQNEAFSRILIDKALEFSGWNLLDSHQVRFELNTENGRADYLLGGQRGPLCILEAKRWPPPKPPAACALTSFSSPCSTAPSTANYSFGQRV
ncbi:MAG: hypothetical protein WDM80_15875 [Limisphaerales bacterium]